MNKINITTTEAKAICAQHGISSISLILYKGRSITNLQNKLNKYQTHFYLIILYNLATIKWTVILDY